MGGAVNGVWEGGVGREGASLVLAAGAKGVLAAIAHRLKSPLWTGITLSALARMLH